MRGRRRSGVVGSEHLLAHTRRKGLWVPFASSLPAAGSINSLLFVSKGKLCDTLRLAAPMTIIRSSVIFLLTSPCEHSRQGRRGPQGRYHLCSLFVFMPRTYVRVARGCWEGRAVEQAGGWLWSSRARAHAGDDAGAAVRRRRGPLWPGVLAFRLLLAFWPAKLLAATIIRARR
jgi:hypothetical protein